MIASRRDRKESDSVVSKVMPRPRNAAVARDFVARDFIVATDARHRANFHTTAGRGSIRLLHALAARVVGSIAVLSAAGLSAAESDPLVGGIAAEAAQKAGVQKQRQQQIERYEKNLEPRLQGVVDGELELVRGSCGSLSPAARREIFTAGKMAVATAARRLATFWLGGQQGEPFDARKDMQQAIYAAVKPHATPEEFAAYERERAARLARRGIAARASIVARLDDKLHLSTAQRAAIAADLEGAWKDDWSRELTDPNFVRLAPDFADGHIAPHLNTWQRTAWKTWREQSGANQAPRHAPNPFQAIALPPQHDTWWTP